MICGNYTTKKRCGRGNNAAPALYTRGSRSYGTIQADGTCEPIYLNLMEI